VEITGKIIELLTEKSGQSANGQWRKQEYVLQTEAEYPKKVCFMVWGDKIDQFNIKQGENLTVSIDLESREYNGRWYTDVKAWKVSRDGAETNHSGSFGSQDNYEPSRADMDALGDDVIPF
jgi:hypothetical protein